MLVRWYLFFAFKTGWTELLLVPDRKIAIIVYLATNLISTPPFCICLTLHHIFTKHTKALSVRLQWILLV